MVVKAIQYSPSPIQVDIVFSYLINSALNPSTHAFARSITVRFYRVPHQKNALPVH